MSKKVLILLVILALTTIFNGCRQTEKNENVKEITQEHQLRIGKTIHFSISEDETVDAEHLRNVMDGKIKKDVPYFDMLDKATMTNLIEYMENNEYEIIPGEYGINQGWRFKDGLFIVGDETREILKFKKK